MLRTKKTHDIVTLAPYVFIFIILLSLAVLLGEKKSNQEKFGPNFIKHEPLTQDEIREAMDSYGEASIEASEDDLDTLRSMIAGRKEEGDDILKESE